MFSIEKIVLDKRGPEPRVYPVLSGTCPAGSETSAECCCCSGLWTDALFRIRLETGHCLPCIGELIKAGFAERKPNKSLLRFSLSGKKLEGRGPAIVFLQPELFSSYIKKRESTGVQYIKGILDCAANLNYAVSVLQLPQPETPLSEVASFIDSRLSTLSGLIHLGNKGRNPNNKIIKNE